MVCDICKKKSANIHFTQIINTEITELHLCESCAKKKGMSGWSSLGHSFSLPSLVLPKLLEGLTELEIPEKETKCEVCGLTFSELARAGRLGCSQCYKTFRQNILPILKQIHGRVEHTGKVPLQYTRRLVRMRLKNRISILQRKLKEAVAKEEYERAAKIRDQIRSLEKDMDKEQAKWSSER